ncbi:MAG: initiation control protein YabA [Syntrophomonadaceae bacterium]|nr:initiation control protein YabA [Syntrophomonadaceae bacterium]
MEKTVQELKQLMREMMLEIGELKERIIYLEREVVRREIAPDTTGRENAIKIQGESYEGIGRIYSEGYHICPFEYGQPRNEDCLFCIALLEKE